MNTLHYPLRILENEDNTVTILVSHEPVITWLPSEKAKQKDQHDKTREFCNWIRRKYPDVATEFRYLGKKLGARRRSSTRFYRPLVNCDKHFVAYNMTKNELMMIRLSWNYTSQKAELGGKQTHELDSYVLENHIGSLKPTTALLERLKNKKPLKNVKI